MIAHTLSPGLLALLNHTAQALRSLGWGSVLIALHDDDTRAFHTVAAAADTPAEQEAALSQANPVPSEQERRQGQRIGNSFWLGATAEAPPEGGEMSEPRLAIPLTANEQELGWIILSKPPGGAIPSEAAVHALETQAELAATVLHQVQLATRMQAEAARQGVLNQIARIIPQHLETPDLCGAVSHHLRTVLPFRQANLILFHSHPRAYECIALDGAGAVRSGSQVTGPLEQLARRYAEAPDAPPVVLVQLDEQRELSEDERALISQGLRAYACVPLHSGRGVIGVFSLATESPGGLRPDDAGFLEQVGEYLAAAVTNARLHQKDQRQRHVADALARLSQIVNSTLELDEVLELALEQLSRVLTYDSAAIMLNDRDTLRITACRGFENPQALIGSVFHLQENNIAHETMRARRARVVGDVQKLANWGHMRDDIEGAHTIRAWIGTPLLVRGQSIGILTLDKHEPDFYTEEDGETATTFAVHIATAINNARLYKSEHLRRQTASALAQIAQTINSTLEPTEVLDLALDQLRHVINYDTASILLLEGRNLVIAACRGFSSPQHVLGTLIPPDEANFAYKALREQRTFFVRDVQQAADWGHGRDDVPDIAAIRSWIGAPLIVRGQGIGVLTIDKREPDFYTAEDAETATAFATQFTTAIQNARLYQVVAKQRDRLAAILTDASDAVIVLDTTNLIWLLNPAAERFLNVKYDAVAGHPLRRVGLPELTEAFEAAQGSQAASTCEIVAPGGTTFHASIAPVRDVGWVIVMQDITPLKELDRLRTEWIAAVSHDLKNPIQVVQMGAALLEMDSPLSREQLERVHMIQRSAAELSDLVTNVLDLARLEAGPSLRLAAVNLREVLGAAVAEIEHLAVQKRQQLVVEPGAPLPSLMGDEALLRRMLINLLSNAIKFTPEGGQIVVKARATEGALEIEIADNGQGIPADSLPYLFDRFYRVPSATADGTGLGLSIVKSIVDRHHGTVHVSSTPGQGSTFTVTLPLAKAG